MSKNKGNRRITGFTLVELLAVIVILAIILVIAVPQIIDTIKDATKASLESSAKMVASQVENQYTVAQTLGKEFGDTGSCMQDWAGLNETDYASCTYEVTSSGEAKVTIAGSGKFKGFSVCNATRSSATAVEGECVESEIASTKIENLLSQESTLNNGLKHITTTYTDYDNVTHSLDAGIRYVGESPNNYVEFNNEVWRIIGLVDAKTSSGNTEKLIKIIRDEPLINAGINKQSYVYGSTSSTYDLSIVLNGFYINNSTICEYYSEEAKNCTESIVSINDTYVNMIEEVIWNSGYASGARYSNSSLALSYYNEINPEDWAIWSGKVGLIYPSDYGLASNDANCANSMAAGGTCSNNNWLQSSEEYWTMSENCDDSDMIRIIYVSSDGISLDFSRLSKNIRPVVYLKPNVKLIGKGTNDDNIFRLSM